MAFGSKLWKLKYRFAGLEKKLSLGAYPEVSLAAARDVREEARKQLVNNIDPGILKNSIKRSKKLVGENSFEAIAREWHTKFTPKWTKEHGSRTLLRLEKMLTVYYRFAAKSSVMLLLLVEQNATCLYI